MSYILIDAGNSSLKLSILDNIDNSDIYYTILDYNNLFSDLVDELQNQIVSAVLVSNVNNPVIYHIIADVVYQLWRIQPQQVIVQQDRYGISTRYNNPRVLGVDRWLAMIAARAEFNKTLCVIDCGTAVTVDVVSDEGMHLGGLITPGLKMSRDALGMKTNNLPLVENNSENNNNKSSFLATTTKDAILGGTLYQISAYIERIVSEIKQEFGDNIECIISGGDAEKFQALTLHQFHYRETLILEGLRIVASDLLDKECI